MTWSLQSETLKGPGWKDLPEPALPAAMLGCSARKTRKALLASLLQSCQHFPGQSLSGCQRARNPGKCCLQVSWPSSRRSELKRGWGASENSSHSERHLFHSNTQVLKWFQRKAPPGLNTLLQIFFSDIYLSSCSPCFSHTGFLAAWKLATLSFLRSILWLEEPFPRHLYNLTPSPLSHYLFLFIYFTWLHWS